MQELPRGTALSQQGVKAPLGVGLGCIVHVCVRGSMQVHGDRGGPGLGRGAGQGSLSPAMQTPCSNTRCG